MTTTTTTESEPIQLPLALVHGDAVIEKPEDLYIPPEALKIFLETFEGPLDFLLYLIRKQKFDILELPIVEITRQYMSYVELMREINLNLASEYLVMASILGEIKSRMLLPALASDEEDEEDPRANLIKQLLEYEKIKKAAEVIDELPRRGRDFHPAAAAPHQECKPKVKLPTVTPEDLILAIQGMIQRCDNFKHHEIKKETLSTRARMSAILASITDDSYHPFERFFTAEEGRGGVVVTFLAILELVKESFIELTQAEPLSAIYVKRSTNEEAMADLSRIS